MSELDWLSWFLDICPAIGETKAVLQLILGRDIITQEELNAFDRASCAISLIPVTGWLAKIPKNFKGAKHIPKFEKFLNFINKANKASNAFDKYNIIKQALENSGCIVGEKEVRINTFPIGSLFCPVQEGKYIVHSAIDFKYVWDVDINSSNLQVWEKHGGANQQFIFKQNSHGNYTIICVQNGKAIDCAYSSKDNGAKVWLYEQNDTSAQHWIIHEAGPNPFLFFTQIKLYSEIDYPSNKRCLDLKHSNAQNGTNIWVYNANESNAQKWCLVPA